MQADDLLRPHPTYRDSITVWRPFNLPTLGVQILTGVGGYMVGGIVSLPFQTGREITSFLLLSGVGFASGVYFGGKWMGGNGEFVPTVVYPAIGAAGIVGIVWIAAGQQSKGELSGIGGAIILGAAGAAFIVGTFLGYHLSASPTYRQVEMGFSPSENTMAANTSVYRIIEANNYKLTFKVHF
jgi:hypothetical protein